MNHRQIESVVSMPLHRFSANTHAYVLRPDRKDWMDPFLGVDYFFMADNCFLPHPHGGMSAVTLLLSQSVSPVLNRDSLGDVSVIHPGDLHWTQAGRGVVHEETPTLQGQFAIGLQIFVDMPQTRRHDAPFVHQSSRADMPVLRHSQADVVLVAGEWGGLQAPLSTDDRWAQPVTLLDVQLAPFAQIDLSFPADQRVWGVVTQGALMGAVAGQTIAQRHAVFWSMPAINPDLNGAPVSLQSGEQGAQVVVFAGVPNGQAVVQHGPFAGGNSQDIAYYLQTYRQGGMGELIPSFHR